MDLLEYLMTSFLITAGITGFLITGLVFIPLTNNSISNLGNFFLSIIFFGSFTFWGLLLVLNVADLVSE